jgi:hypothetical protein
MKARKCPGDLYMNAALESGIIIPMAVGLLAIKRICSGKI